MTNLEKKRQMNDEEFVNWIKTITACGCCPAENYCAKQVGKDCKSSLKAWFNSEVEE